MTRRMTPAQRDIHASLETRDRYQQAALEGAALRGELGLASQLLAMSEHYRELRAAGRIGEARAVKEAACRLLDAAEERN